MATLPPIVDANRLALNPLLAPLVDSAPDLLARLALAASAAVRKFCHRDFTVNSYTEYHSPRPNSRAIYLRQYPVVSVSRVAVANQCLQVLNSGGAYQRATVATNSVGVTLTTLASGVSATTTITYAAQNTVGKLAAAINALGNGWSTAIWSGSYGSFANWPSADLRATQGALMALNGGAYLEIYEDWNAGSAGAWGWDGESSYGGMGAGWRLDEETGELSGRWPRGRLNLRIDYTAGFATLPADVEEAAAQWAKDLYAAAANDPTTLGLRLGDYSQTTSAKPPAMSATVAGLLRPYVARDKVIAR